MRARNDRTLLHHRRPREEDIPPGPRGAGLGRYPADRDDAHLQPVLDLCRARLRAEEAERLPLAPSGGPAGDLLPRPEGRDPLPLQHLPASRRTGLHRARRQPAQLQVRLSRLDLPQRRRRWSGVPGSEAYRGEFDKSKFGLRSPARFEHYRDFWFLNLEADAPSLRDYLGGAKDYIDLVIDQSPSGQMEIVAGVQEYDVAANWKLMVENSRRRLSPAEHAFDLAQLHGQFGREDRTAEGRGLVLPTHGLAVDLGNGHFTTDNVNFRGRPVASVDSDLRRRGETRDGSDPRELVARLGPERAKRVCRHQPQPRHLPQPCAQRRVIGHGAHVLSRWRRQDACDRVGAGSRGGNASGPCAPARCIPHVLWTRRLRDARRRRSARTGAAGARQLAGRPLVGDVARHGQAKASSSTATSTICASSGGAGAR